MRKIIIIFAMTLFMAAALGLSLWAQEQKSGQPLLFDKDSVEEHPSDLHMGSDPYYHKEKHKFEGSDETGYPREYDPGMEYREPTTIKKVYIKKEELEEEEKEKEEKEKEE